MSTTTTASPAYELARRRSRSGSLFLEENARPVLPKYRHPETGETWSGRGSAPGWLRRLEEQGRRREEFAIGGGV
jgi:DNA-binding protein H-NS